MLLLAVKKYLVERKKSSLLEVMHYFKLESNSARTFLEYWCKKGAVKCINSTITGCGTRCKQCNPLSLECYQWIGYSDSLINEAPAVKTEKT